MLLAIGAALIGAQSRPDADLIVTNATIYTVDERRPTAEALAVRDGRFAAVGRAAEIERWRGSRTTVLDLGGATVVPGLQDAHGHFLGLGAQLAELDLRDTSSYEEVLRRVAARAREVPAGAWILGRAWDQNDWPGKAWPDGAALDRVAPENPVFLTRVDGHAAVASRAALARGGVGRDTPDPPGGRLLRSADGQPTGVLIDAAQGLVSRLIPQPGADELIRRAVWADRECARLGLTMVHDAGVAPEEIELLRRLAADGRLSTRLYVMLTGGDTGDWLARGPAIDPAHRFTVRAVKLMADGALGSRGAALLEDYADEPGNRGLLVTPPETLDARARAAAGAGFQVCIHAIGDRANRRVLDVFERLQRDVPPARDLRLRVEHAQILDEADVTRFARLGVVASMQATHATSDMPWVADRIGAGRAAEGAYAWRRLLDSGAVIANGSDFPVERPDPLLGFYAAISRQDPAGHPPGGWLPSERMTRDEALRSFTLDAAFAAHAERDLGSIVPGKLADLVVLSRDIMKAPPGAIPGTRVLRTIVAGRTVFEATPNSPN